MDFEFRQALENELDKALLMLKEAAERLQSKHVNQWAYWLNPSQEKINWIREGFQKKEFYFIVQADEIIGMFRLLNEDDFFWGKEPGKAKYIHSFVIKTVYVGNKIGERVLERIGKNAINENVFILRLDCNSTNSKLCEYYESQGFIKIRQKLTPNTLNNLYEKKLK